MRHSNQSARGTRLPSWLAGFVALLAAGVIVAACGGSNGPSGPPSAEPTPVVTPDPHLHEPVTADEIYRAFQAAKLEISPNNANLGGGNPRIVKQINAEVGNWPLRITQYTTSADLQKSLGWKPNENAVRNDAPYGFAGLNISVEFGPIDTAGTPGVPNAERQQLATSIVAVLDPLLWPLVQHSVAALPARTLPPPPTVAPSTKPSPKASAKASKAP